MQINWTHDLLLPGYWLEHAKTLQWASNSLLTGLLEAQKKFHSTMRHGSEEEMDRSRLSYLGHLNSFMLIRGLAIENFLKGLSIQKYLDKNPEVELTFETVKKEAWKIKHSKYGFHDTLKIVKTICLEIPDDWRDFFERHREYVYWAGKYHNAKNLEMRDKAYEEERLATRARDYHLWKNIFETLYREVYGEDPGEEPLEFWGLVPNKGRPKGF